jgi:hypothetical protein
MRATTVTVAGGKPELITGELPLRQHLDDRFDSWISERMFHKDASDKFWYETEGDHTLASDRAAGEHMRRPLIVQVLVKCIWSSFFLSISYSILPQIQYGSSIQSTTN